MRRTHRMSWATLIAIAWRLMVPAPLLGQHVQVQTPLVRSSEGFHEHFGVNMGFRQAGPNGYVFFNSGGQNGAIPPFGGYDPNNASNFGLGFLNNRSNFFLNFTASQGSQRSVVGTAPGVTVTNGYPGQVFDGVSRPFVTGFVPVVGGGGGYPAYGNGLPPLVLAPSGASAQDRIARYKAGERATALETGDQEGGTASSSGSDESRRPASPTGAGRHEASSAERGDISLAEIRRQLAEEDRRQQEEVDLLEAKAERALAMGKNDVAKQYFRQAAKLADRERRDSILRKIRDL